MNLPRYKISKKFRKEIKQVIITGGEPFLRKDIFEIVKLFKNQTSSIDKFYYNGLLTKVLEDTEKLLNLHQEIKDL